MPAILRQPPISCNASHASHSGRGRANCDFHFPYAPLCCLLWLTFCWFLAGNLLAQQDTAAPQNSPPPDQTESSFLTSIPTSPPSLPSTPILLALPEASFQRPAVMVSIADSQHTVETFAFWDGEKLAPLTVEESARLDRENPAWMQDAREASAFLLEDVQLRWVRDAEGVVQGVYLQGTHPATASLLFAPALLERFEDVLGPEFLAAVPSRWGLVLIPRLASNPGAFAASILTEYRRSSHPVSEEIFLLGDGPPRAVGRLDDR